MHPTPDEFEACVDRSDGFPRPNWRLLWERYCGGVEGGPQFCEAEQRVQRLWLGALRASLGGRYAVHESPRLLLLSEDEPSAGADRLAHFERVLDVIFDSLEGIAPPQGLPGRLAILYFSEEDDYYAYIAEYYPTEGQFGMSCGVCFRRDEVHVAINGAAETPHVTLVHEMVHACLAHLELPTWLEEGIVAVVEHVASDKEKTDELARWQRDAQAQFWGPIGLQEYWSGASFHAPDEAAAYSYQLAEVMVRAILRLRQPAFDTFVCRATFADAGQRAALEVLDAGLVSIVEHCIGQGPWLPPFPFDKVWRVAFNPD